MRIREWSDIIRQKRLDYGRIIDDDPTQVYRAGTDATKAGFEEDIADYEFSHRLICKLAKNGIAETFRAGNEKVVVYNYIGLTLERDVRINDRWLWLDNDYIITSVDNDAEYVTRVKLKRYKDEQN